MTAHDRFDSTVQSEMNGICVIARGSCFISTAFNKARLLV
jgi:hypothetical protein